MRRRTLLTGTLALAACPVRALAQTRPGWADEGREPRDPSALDREERLHVPVLTLPEQVRAGRPFDLVVQIGLDPHPMAAGHHVDWIEATLGDARGFVADLSPHVGYAIVRVPIVVAAPTLLTVRAHCTVHGTWRTRRPLSVR